MKSMNNPNFTEDDSKGFIIPEIFKTKDISGKEDALLCANLLEGWALCCAGVKPPNFGDVAAMIAMKLHILGTPESCSEWAKKWHESLETKTES